MDPELIEKARRGSPEALDALIRALAPALLQLARRLTGDAQSAEDLVSEALYRGVLRLRKLRETEAAERWFRRILLNVWKDGLRRRNRKELFLEDIEEPPAPDDSDPATQAQEAEMRAELERAVSALPPGQRAVMTLRLFGELSVAEIAEMLETTADRVKASLYHARQKLRQLFFSDAELERGEKRSNDDSEVHT